MKRTIIAVLGISTLIGLGAYMQQSKRSTVTAVEPVPEGQAPAESSSAEPAGANPVATIPQKVDSAAVTPPPPVTDATALRAEQALEAASAARTVDVLVSPMVPFGQKRETWHQLRQSGQLDSVIKELEQRIVQDPQTATYPAELGQAYLQKCAVTDDMREKGILAMQADKLFETALNLDPSNWEARFTKAVAMSYWPPVLKKGEEVIQQFQMLIQQQEAEPPQPQFAETYGWLGDQYQKSGHMDEALAVWQRGASLFPDDGNLRKKLAAATEPAVTAGATQQ